MLLQSFANLRILDTNPDNARQSSGVRRHCPWRQNSHVMQCGQAMRLRLYTLLPVAVTMADLPRDEPDRLPLPASDLLGP